MLVASAVRLKDGRVFVGKRHGDCYSKMKDLGLQIEECNNGATQGFITDRLFFLDRKESYSEARLHDQCKEQVYNPVAYAKGLEVKREDWHPVLFSEDLW